MVFVTRLLCRPASSITTKFIMDAMQKLTLTMIRRKDAERRFVVSSFNPLNKVILGCYGPFSEVPAV